MKVSLPGLVLVCGVACASGAAQTGGAPPDQSVCSIFAPATSPLRSLDDAGLLAAYNAQVNAIRSLHIAALMRAKSGKEYGIGDQTREIPAILDFARPDLIRMTGVLPFMSSRGFELASDGHVFRLLVPEDGKKTFMVGPVDAPAHSKNPRENLRPQPLLDALRWQVATARNVAHAKPVASANFESVEVDLPPTRTGPTIGRIEFDLRAGVVGSMSTYDSSGQLLSEVSYQEWKPMIAYPAGTTIGCFPRRIHLSQQAGDFELTIHITDIALNPDISKSIFKPSPPRGIPVVQVDMSGNTNPHN